MTSLSISVFGEEALRSQKVWRIYKSQQEVERELDIGPLLPFTQDLASLICAKTKQPLYKLTYRGKTREECQMRQYFVFFMRFHPYLEPWSTAERTDQNRTCGLALKNIAKLINRDHTSVNSAWQGSHRGLRWELQRQPNGAYAYDLRWISDNLQKINPCYGWLNVGPFLGRAKTDRRGKLLIKEVSSGVVHAA